LRLILLSSTSSIPTSNYQLPVSAIFLSFYVCLCLILFSSVSSSPISSINFLSYLFFNCALSGYVLFCIFSISSSSISIMLNILIIMLYLSVFDCISLLLRFHLSTSRPSCFLSCYVCLKSDSVIFHLPFTLFHLSSSHPICFFNCALSCYVLFCISSISSSSISIMLIPSLRFLIMLSLSLCLTVFLFYSAFICQLPIPAVFLSCSVCLCLTLFLFHLFPTHCQLSTTSPSCFFYCALSACV
jgi:hypothetical protein